MTTPIRPPCIHLIAPWQIHSWTPDSIIEGTYLAFNEFFVMTSAGKRNASNHLATLFHIGNTGLLQLTPEQQSTVDSLMQSMLAENRLGEKRSTSILKAYLHIFLENLYRWTCAEPVGSPSSIQTTGLVHRFYQLVTERAAKCRQVGEYARELNVTHGHLSEVIKATTNKTPGELIRNHVVLEAKRLLTYTDASIKEISYQLQFEDPSYFGRFFRREVGTSPGLYRLQSRKKCHHSGSQSLFPDEFS